MPVSQSEAWRELEYTFTRNEPKDIKSQAETAQMLMGITSEETALSVLSVVSDTKAELEKIEAQKPKVPYDFEKGADEDESTKETS